VSFVYFVVLLLRLIHARDWCAVDWCADCRVVRWMDWIAWSDG